MRPCGVIFEIVPHAESTSPQRWTGDHDLRPLTGLGHEQARALVPALGTGIDAVYSSPAVRCTQTVQPLADALGLPITEVPELLETRGFAEPKEWTEGDYRPIGQALGGAWAAGKAWRAMDAMDAMARKHSGRRVVACSHGDVIPVLLAMLCARYDTALPAWPGRGGWYTLRLDGDYLVCSSQLA